MIMNLKKLLAKIPGGGSKIGTFAAALFLVKEEKDVYNMTDEEIEERVKTYLLSEETKQLIDEEFVVGDTVLIESHNIEGEISHVEEAWVHIQSKGQGMIAHKENVKKNQEDLLLEDEEKVAVVGKHPRTRVESRRIFKKSEMSIAQQIAKEWREKGYGGVIVKDLPDSYMEATENKITIEVKPDNDDRYAWIDVYKNGTRLSTKQVENKTANIDTVISQLKGRAEKKFPGYKIVQEGIIIPRPAIRNKERRVIDSMLKRHKELTDRYMAQGMSKTDASAKAMQAVRGKIEEDINEAKEYEDRHARKFYKQLVDNLSKRNSKEEAERQAQEIVDGMLKARNWNHRTGWANRTKPEKIEEDVEPNLPGSYVIKKDGAHSKVYLTSDHDLWRPNRKYAAKFNLTKGRKKAKEVGGVLIKEDVMEETVVPVKGMKFLHGRVIKNDTKEPMEYVVTKVTPDEVSFKAVEGGGSAYCSRDYFLQKVCKEVLREDVEMNEKWKSTWIDTKSTGLRGRRLKTFRGGRASAEVEWQKIVAAKKDDKENKPKQAVNESPQTAEYNYKVQFVDQDDPLHIKTISCIAATENDAKTIALTKLKKQDNSKTRWKFVKAKVSLLDEDAPANAVSGGGIAGMTPEDTPGPGSRIRRKILRRKKKIADRIAGIHQ